MAPTTKRGSRTIEIDTQHTIFSVLFAENGKRVWSGGREGMLRQWRAEDGQGIGEPIRTDRAEIGAAVLSPDGRWLVCGLSRYRHDGETWVAVWDAQTHKKVHDIQGQTNTVLSVDISPDSTKLATGGSGKNVFIHGMTTGERLVGPLKHDGWVVAVQFSTDGGRIATASVERSLRIYDSENGQQLLDIPFRFPKFISSPLSWSTDGRIIFVAASGGARCFDTLSGTRLSQWSFPGSNSGERSASIALARNHKFIVIVTFKSLSFWDTSTHRQIGTVIQHASPVYSIALSPNDDCIVTGEHNGKVTLRSLRDILPSSYLTANVNGERPDIRTLPLVPTTSLSLTASQLPFMHISNETFTPWMQGDLACVEELLTQDIIHPSDPLHRARALAHRALVRVRLKRWDMAISDAKTSIKIQRSVIGHIAYAISLVGSGEHQSGINVFDIVFSYGLPSEDSKLLLLIKAIMLFECGKHDDAISRVDQMIDVVDEDQSPCTAVRAQMLLLLGRKFMTEGDNERAIALFKRGKEAVPFQQGSCLAVISLMFGWKFDQLSPVVQLYLWKAMYTVGDTEVDESLSTIVETFGEEVLTSEVITDWDPDLVQKCLTVFESNGDEAAKSKNLKRAIAQYSAALSLNTSNPAGLLLKRGNTRILLGLWEDALKDADNAIKADPSSPWGYEKRHVALHCLRRYDEGISAFARMLLLIGSSLDQDVRRLGEKYISPPRLERIIDDAIRRVLKMTPLVLIDVGSGHLLDEAGRMCVFKSEPEFKELLSSMVTQLDNGRIQGVIEEYFRFVMLSHVWEGKEPSFQDVISASSVWELDSSPLNEKLRKFCGVVRANGYRWAWSDTCCIDKTISTVLNQSLKMMYRWYEASTATFVLLVDVASPSSLGDLTGSIWMKRAWTSQELLAPEVVRFYNSDWQPYLGDNRFNHKESPKIMQELAHATKIARETIMKFHPDNLTIREKLRLASTRDATVEEDIAYSLIGIFKSDIRPDYGEGDAALGHLLEEIVARSGDVTVLDWTGKSSSYNSCLPATLSVYSQLPCSSPAIYDATTDVQLTALRKSLSRTNATRIYDRINRLPPARFANRRLHLPCIIFTVGWFGVQDSESTPEKRYRARVSGIGKVEFQTSDKLWLTEAHKLIFVHPWIRHLRSLHHGFTSGSTADDGDEESDSDTGSGFTSTSSLHDLPRSPRIDEDTRALQLVDRLQQPFHALLLQQLPHGEFKRVAAEHEIVLPGLKHPVRSTDIRTEVVEIL